jgi:hypothetical protein
MAGPRRRLDIRVLLEGQPSLTFAFGGETGMLTFPPVYQRSVRLALICQVISLLLVFMVLDLGEFALRFLCLSLAFWVLAGILMALRRHPNMFERAFIASGPMLIFFTMFFVG